MGIVIAVGMGKGGVGKSTNSAVLCDLLAFGGHKVLGIDFDSQGNFTKILSQKSLLHFEDKTVFDAIKSKDPLPYIYKVTNNLDLLPADDFLSLLGAYIRQQFIENGADFVDDGPDFSYKLLSKTIKPLRQKYDYIIIDLPPTLGDHTINGLVASDYTIAVYLPEDLCDDGLPRYLETVEIVVDKYNPNLKVAGILVSKMDSRISEHKEHYQKVRSNYPDLVFNSVIPERAAVKEYPKKGILKETTKQLEVLESYTRFVGELLERVRK